MNTFDFIYKIDVTKPAVKPFLHNIRRTLPTHAPKHFHDELTEGYRDMIYADTAAEVRIAAPELFLKIVPLHH